VNLSDPFKGTRLDEDLIYLNGLNGAGPGYLLEPLHPDELRRQARRLKPEELFGSEDHAQALQDRDTAGAAHLDLAAYINPANLKQTGWGLIFPGAMPEVQVDALLERLSVLVAMRKEAAGDRFKLYRGASAPQPGESADQWVARNGLQPGTVNPAKIPYYLLLVGSPEEISFQFQFELDVQFAVGRLYFDDLDGYAHYASGVVHSESPTTAPPPRRAAFFSVANPDDPPTRLSAARLIQPLYNFCQGDELASLGWHVNLFSPEQAVKANLLNLLESPQPPALLFTASHGLGYPLAHPQQFTHQGALVCQDWPGPLNWNQAPIADMFLSAEDITSSLDLSGRIAFLFACFSAGAPEWDDFAAAKGKERQRLAEPPFLAALPQRLLDLPKGGVLAVIGHIGRSWGYSFAWSGAEGEPESFKSMLYQLLSGMPVGHALEPLNQRYAQIATLLSEDFQQARYDPDYDAKLLASHWIANNDARSYAILGDPAVKFGLE
jgi:hypothetical protein